MPPQLPGNSDWRHLAAREPPKWHGDLDDDCTAQWAGFTLRAEWMVDDVWWWCVYEGDEQIASSNDSETPCTSGERHGKRRSKKHGIAWERGRHNPPLSGLT